MLDRILSPLLLKERSAIYQETVEGRQFDTFYFFMMICSCLLALLGLLMNSPAVIIGAMLISPLMGPVLGCGLALAIAEGPMGRKSGRNVLFSIVEVVVIAAIATRLSPLHEATPEILARTNPNIMDLLVALFSGLAGTLAACSRRAGASVLPGVAIAVAVMPPLATTGYGIATSQWQIAGGAFMLFVTNLTAIILSSSAVFALAGFRPQRDVTGEPHPWLVRYRIGVAVVLLALLSIPLARTLIHSAQQARLRSTARNVLRDALFGGGRRLDQVSVQTRPDRVSVEATVQTQQYIEPEKIREIQLKLAENLGRPVSLDLQQVQLASQRPADFIASGVVHAAQVEPPEPLAESVGKIQDRIRSALAGSLATLGISDVQVLAIGKQGGDFLVEIEGTATSFTHDDAWQLAAASLTNTTGAPVRLRGSIVLANDTLQLPFDGKSTRLSARETRNLQEFAAKHGAPSFRFALVSDPSAPLELAGQRLQGLKNLLPGPIVTRAGLAAPQVAGVKVYVFQTFETQVRTASAPPAKSSQTTSQPVS
jgi:uncharacterized hydrophobic protein (TIGR00271 family)